jgi:broad specificity phosphatase PhoE
MIQRLMAIRLSQGPVHDTIDIQHKPAKEKAMIHLVRHGQTSWNKKDLFQGLRDIPLDETGHIQARRAASFFKDVPVTRIISSDLSRASMTAQAIQDVTGAPLSIDTRLRELDVGLLEGKSWKDADRDHPGVRTLFSGKNGDTPIPGGESFDMFKARCLAVFEDILEDDTPDTHTVVVTHGGVIRMILFARFGERPGPDGSIRIDNGSITTIVSDKEKTRTGLVRVNMVP